MDSRRGYTLIEILAVLVVLGIAIALAQVSFARSPAQTLEQEAHRLAIVLELARDDAMVQGCTTTWTSRSGSHWVECRGNRAAHATHAWPGGIALERMSIAGVPVPRESPLIFTPAGLNAPFELTLAMEDSRVVVSGDVLGRVSVSR